VIRKFLPACNRVAATISSACFLFLFLILSGLVNHLFAAGIQAPVRGPKIWLGDNQALPVKPVGAPTLAQSVAAGQAQPTAMATADVDGDGVADLIAGFSAPGGGAIVIHRGNMDAFAPQSDASFQAIGRGQFPAPFLPNAKVFSVPVRPDFIDTILAPAVDRIGYGFLRSGQRKNTTFASRNHMKFGLSYRAS